MSSFRGRLVNPELGFITIDFFDPGTYQCEIFLLSHHHCDHMKGIFCADLARIINESSSKFVYCSPLTGHFLRKNPRFRVSEKKVRLLQLGKSVVIQQDKLQTHIVITALPAAHCVGSVMFLIEYADKRILYSGDIRLTLADLKNIRGTVTNPDGSPITIDDLYLDTTFAVPTKLKDFPSRDESERTIIDFIKKYWSSSPEGKVVFNLAARFGYESLFIAVYKSLKVPVVFHDRLMVYYEDIEQIRDYITSSSQCGDNNWRIHACVSHSSDRCELVKSNGGVPVKVIKPCALGFVQDNDVKIYEKYVVPYDDQPHFTRVFYATHCSLNELRDIYQFLKPKRVFPSVKGNQSHKTILELIGVERNERKSVECPASPSSRQRKREYERQHADKRRLLDLD